MANSQVREEGVSCTQARAPARGALVEPRRRLPPEEQVRMDQQLIGSIRNRDLRGVKAALAGGADRNARDVRGQSALQLAESALKITGAKAIWVVHDALDLDAIAPNGKAWRENLAAARDEVEACSEVARILGGDGAAPAQPQASP